MHRERLQVPTLAVLALGLLCSRICAVPGASTITWPGSGALPESNVPDITWSGSGCNSFECHVCTVDDPKSGIVWNSGQVHSTAKTVMTGYLPVQTTYYASVASGHPCPERRIPKEER